MRPTRSDVVDVTVQLRHETPLAILVSDTGKRQDAVWLPRSQIEIELSGKGLLIVTMPKRLAIEKGLV